MTKNFSGYNAGLSGIEQFCGANETMKHIIGNRIVMSLWAISMPAVLAYAQTDCTPPAGANMMYERVLPEVVVSADWSRPAPVTGAALCADDTLHHEFMRFSDSPLMDSGTLCRQRLDILLKTNMLSDLALMPAAGLEVGLGKGWSIGGNVTYGWWTDRSKFYWRAFAADMGIRKYFGRNMQLTGHHVGLYAGIMTYDFELGGRGVICDWREEWGRYAGLEYGYALPVGKCLRIDFSLGVGYAGGVYKEYLPSADGVREGLHYVWQSTDRLHYFGPTRLEISLVWNLDFSRKIK